MSEQAIILDLQRSVDAMTNDRDRWKVISHGLARYIVTEVMKVTDADELNEKIAWLIGQTEEGYREAMTNHMARTLRGK